MSEKHKARTLLQAAATPMTPADVAEFAKLIEDQRANGPAIVARWSPATGVCVVGLALDGELLAWRMFPADSKELAHEVATELQRSVLEDAVEVMKQAASAKATTLEAINKARSR